MKPLLTCLLILVASPCSAQTAVKERHYLYVVAPGIRNYLEFGGAGILVFDIDNDHKFVKRIATPPSQDDEAGEHQGRLRQRRHEEALLHAR